MSGTNGYGANDAGLRAQKLRGQIRWRSKQVGIQTTRGGPSGSFSSDASYMIDTSLISDSGKQCEACESSLAPVSPPGPPQNVQSYGYNETIVITWDAPRTVGLTYRVVCPALSFDQSGITTMSCTISSSVVNGTTYTCTVYAINSGGSSSGVTAPPVTPSITRTVFATVGTVTWTAPPGLPSVQYLVVGGGGGGGGSEGYDLRAFNGFGGGGGGMVKTDTTSVIHGSEYTIIVGGGGLGTYYFGGNGLNSMFGVDIIALGGGGGG